MKESSLWRYVQRYNVEFAFVKCNALAEVSIIGSRITMRADFKD